MSDQKKADEQKPIQDETLDKVSGGAGSDYIIIHNPIDRSHEPRPIPPGPGQQPPSDPRPRAKPT